MWDEEVVANFAAAADAVVPGSSGKGAHIHAAGLFDKAMFGLATLVAGLLDAFADDVRSGVAFRDLSTDERAEVLRIMSQDEGRDVRDAVDGIFIFVLGYIYSESNPDHANMWRKLDYHGPSKGIRDFA